MTTAAAQLTRSLREAILSGELFPGSRIVIEDIRAAYAVSHIPVREALKWLEAEGLVIHSPHKGSHVAPLVLGEADEVYDLRILLEPVVGLRALERHQQEDVLFVIEARTALDQADPAEDLGRFQECHRDYHWSLLRPGATPTIERILRQVWQVTDRYVRYVFANAPVYKTAAEQHQRLFELWCDRDAAFAQLLTAHLTFTRQELKRRLTALPESTAVVHRRLQDGSLIDEMAEQHQ